MSDLKCPNCGVKLRYEWGEPGMPEAIAACTAEETEEEIIGQVRRDTHEVVDAPMARKLIVEILGEACPGCHGLLVAGFPKGTMDDPDQAKVPSRWVLA